ncbi:DUF134 domain-containing protein [bacterium]|nr:DUF134 domain-containing protein [bacterium]
MPRPRKPRYVTTDPGTRTLVPGDRTGNDIEPIELGWDEYEALRLVDYGGLYQDAAAELLGVSRQTVGRMLMTARAKTISALVEGRPINIEGGDAHMMHHYICDDCSNQWLIFEGSKPSKLCPACGGGNISESISPADSASGQGGRRRKWARDGTGGEPEIGRGPGGRRKGGGGGGGAGKGRGGRGRKR